MSTRPGRSIVEQPDDEDGQERIRRIRQRARQLAREREEGPRGEAMREAERGAAQSSVPTPGAIFGAELLRQGAEAEEERSSRQLDALMKGLGQAGKSANLMFQGLSPLTGYKELFEIASSTSPGEVGEALGRFVQGDFQGSSEVIQDIMARSPTAQRQQALRLSATGGVAQGLADSFASVAEFPAVLLETLPEDFRRDTGVDALTNGIFWATGKARDEARKFAEHHDQMAAQFGASPKDILGSKVTGGFIGFTPVLYGSFKAAELFPFARGAGFKPFFLRDLTAGGIMGVAATKGDLEERAMAAVEETAFFGGWSLALAGLGYPIKAFRQRRLMQNLQKEAMERFIREVEEAWDPNRGVLDLRNLDGETGRAVFQILSEEQAAAQSPKAHRVLSQTADESSLVPALMDLAEGEATHGILRRIKNPDELLPRLRERFPDMEFKASKGEIGADVLFGPKVTDATVKRFTSEGRIKGQRLVLEGGQEVEYLGRTTGGRLRVRYLDSGREIPGGVPERIVSDLPFARQGEPSDELMGVVEQFTDQFFSRVEQVTKNRGGMTQDEIVQAAREGRLAELGMGQRSVRDYPVEGGVSNAQVLGVREPQLPPEQVARTIAEEGLETFWVSKPSEPVKFRELVEEFARNQGLLEEQVIGLEFHGRISDGQILGIKIGDRDAANVLANIREEYRAVVVREMRPDQDAAFRVSFFRAGDNTPSGRAHAESMDELIEVLEGPLNAREVDRAARLTPEAQNTLTALQSEAARSVRQRMWEMVPDEEKRILQQLRDEVVRTLEDSGPSLRREAAAKGFSVRRTDEGTLMLRDVQGGRGFEVRNEQAAREALSGVKRRFGNDAGRTMFPRFPDEAPSTSGLPPADDFFLTGQPESGQVLERLAGSPKWTNLRKWMQEMEERTGIPVWSQIFEPLDRGQQAMKNDMESWLKRSMDIWSDMSREERAALDPFFQEIAGKQLSQAEVIGIGQRLGLSGKQIRAGLEALKLERAVFQETGLPNFRYLDNHFARVRPVVEQEGKLPQRVADIFDEDLPQRAEAFWQKARTGELANREMDPLLVQLKYLRSVFWDKHMKGPWERARAFVGQRSKEGTPPRKALEFNMRDLSEAQRSRLVNTFIDMEEVRNAHEVMKEYLGRARGYPSEGERSVSRMFKRLAERLDMDVPPEVAEEATNIVMSTMYGAAMGARPQMTARNLTQNLWFSWMRLDGKHGGPSLKDATQSRALWREATEIGATRPQQRGVFGGGAAFEGHLANMPDTGAASRAKSAVMRGLFNLGNASRQTSQKSMIPFGASDDFNRAWAYAWQKRHTRDYLEQLKRGDISEAKFIEEGLRGHSQSVKREFARRFDLLGEEEALRFIGKEHASEAHFLYARQNQPLWMQNDVGKFGGMFGTYSLWAKDYMHSLYRNMTSAQRAQMFAKGAATGAGIFLVGQQLGLDLNNWLSPLSAYTFTGGPGVDIATSFREMVQNATFQPDRFAGSAQQFSEGILRLSYPGAGLQNDFMKAGEMADGLDMQILSIVLGKPERARGNFFMDVMLPYEDNITTPSDHVQQALESGSPPESTPPEE